MKGEGTDVSDEVNLSYIFQLWKMSVVNRRSLLPLVTPLRRWKKSFAKQRLEGNLYNLHTFLSGGETPYQFVIMMIRTRRQLPSFLIQKVILCFPRRSKTLLWLILRKGLTGVNDDGCHTCYNLFFNQAIGGLELKTNIKRDLLEGALSLEHYKQRKFKARLRHTLARSESLCFSEKLCRKIVSFVEYDDINRGVSDYLSPFSKKDAEKEKEWVLSQRRWDNLIRDFKSIEGERIYKKLSNQDFKNLMKSREPELVSSLQERGGGRYLLSLTGIQLERRILWLTPDCHLANPRFLRVLLRKTDLTRGLLNLSFQGMRFGDYIAGSFPKIMEEILELKPQVFFSKGFPDRLRTLNNAIKYLLMIDERHLTRLMNEVMERIPACPVSNWYWERHPVRVAFQEMKNAGPIGKKLYDFIGRLQVMKDEREPIRMKKSEDWRPSKDNTHQVFNLVFSNLSPGSASGRRSIGSYPVLSEKEGWSKPIARQRKENCRPIPNNYSYFSSTLRVTQTEIILGVSSLLVFTRLTIVPQRLNALIPEEQKRIAEALCAVSKQSLLLVCQYLFGEDFRIVISTVLPLLGDINNP